VQRKAERLRSTVPAQRAVPSRSAQLQPPADMTERRCDLAATVILWEPGVSQFSRIVCPGWCVHQCRTAGADPSGCARFPGASGTRFTTRVTLWKHQTWPNRKHTALRLSMLPCLTRRPERWLVNVCRQVVDESLPLVISVWLPDDQVQIPPSYSAANWQSRWWCCGRAEFSLCLASL
jgi:hypothetical protein